MNPTMNPYAAPTANLDQGPARQDLRLAERSARFAASLIDGLVVGLVPVVIMVAAGLAAGVAAGATNQRDLQPNPIPVALAVLTFLVAAVYQTYLLSTTGQTLGKKLTGIKIVRMDGGPVDFGSAFLLRYLVGQGLLHVIPLYGLVDACFIFREDRRCIHDLIASTKVVQAK